MTTAIVSYLVVARNRVRVDQSDEYPTSYLLLPYFLPEYLITSRHIRIVYELILVRSLVIHISNKYIGCDYIEIISSVFGLS